MPVFKISLTDNEVAQIKKLISDENLNLSIQDYFRLKVLGYETPDIFTPEEAIRRALEKYTIDDEPFTLPDIYGSDWALLNPRLTGVFGKKVFNHLKTLKNPPLEFVGMVDRNRRASYQVTLKEN